MHPEQLRALDYLARKGTQASAERLRDQLHAAFAAIEAAFDQVVVDERDVAPAPGKWSAHAILDHLVLSHEPAISQYASLLRGESPEGVAIPADLQSALSERPAWDALRARLGATHREFVRLTTEATDEHSLEPKAIIEIVVKVDGKPLHWFERLDWKAFVQGVRVHTIEHQAQLERTVGMAGS
jgi:hypothetical protein